MAMPIGGIRRPVTIVDCDGAEVTITDGKLNVNATVSVPGDVPQAFTADQDLGVAPLDEQDAIAVVKKAFWMSLHLDAPLANPQQFTITLISADGASYNTVIVDETLAAGFTDKYFAFPCDTLLRAGDHIQVELGTAGGAETATAFLTLMFGV